MQFLTLHTYLSSEICFQSIQKVQLIGKHANVIHKMVENNCVHAVQDMVMNCMDSSLLV